MAPPKKRVRTSPTTTAASSPPASTPTATKPSTAADGAAARSFAPDAWTPAQETALLKLLIHHKPTGIHKHFNMLSIYNSLQSQGLTHTPPSKNNPAAPIEHMMPQNIWKKLDGLYDLETLDEREEHYRLSNTSREGSEAEEDEYQFTHEFDLTRLRSDPANADQAEELSDKMFARRLKTGSEPASSPPLEDRSVSEAPSARGGRGRGGARGTRTSLRQSGPVAGRRGSRTTTATTSTAGDDEDDAQEESDAEDDTKRSSRRVSARETSKRGRGGRKKG